MVAGAAVVLVAVVLCGGKLRRLAYIELRAPWLLLVALLLQILVISIIPDNTSLPLEAIHNATYVMAALFLMLNWRLPGLLVIALGAALNGVTIWLNGGTLPARAGALKTAGLDVESGFTNSGTVADPKLAFLGDIFAIPASWPLANVFSIGDIVILIGFAITVFTVCLGEDAPAEPAATASGERS